MSELQTLVQQSSERSGATARPRISADAFRNLSARLKKPTTVIPELLPTQVAAAPVVDPVQIFAPEPIKTVVPPAQPALVIEVAQPKLEPVFAAPKVDQPLDLAVAAPEIEKPLDLVLAEPDTQAPLDLAFAPPVVEATQPLPDVAWPAPTTLVLAEEVQPSLEIEPVSKLAFPPLELPPGFSLDVPKTEDVATVVVPEVQGAAVEANGSFEENFTYVPEKGKTLEATKPDLSGVEDAIKAEIAQRAVEIELENIWRMMLATPTLDDRTIYLREAAEIHSGDDEWNKPEPEHDLSRIEPAYVAPVGEHPDYDSPAAEDGISLSIPAAPQVAESQDLNELARSLLDMMAAGNASGLPQERALAADTLLRLVPKLELKPLIMLAERLAMMDSPPHMLVAKLIRDPRVEVSGPLLEDCSQISDRDLEVVVAESEPDKLRMIARRRNLSRSMGEVLIKSGDPSVVLTLVRNMEAEISHEGFQSLLVLAESHDELLAPMATRQDFTAQYAFEMFWLAPAQLRRFILSRFLTDSETLTKILKITMATKMDEEGEAEPLNQHVLLEGLERAARGQIERAAEELSGTMQLSTATIQKILSDLQGDALVVMLKAAGYPRSAVSGLLKRMQAADMPLVSRDRDVSELQNMFETLSFNKARILLTYWDWAQSKTGPYALAH